MCVGCKGMLWIEGMMNKDRERCPHVSLTTGELSDGELCRVLNFQNEDYRAILPGYICAKKHQSTSVRKSKYKSIGLKSLNSLFGSMNPNKNGDAESNTPHEERDAESVIPYERKDGKLVKH
ncbi:hypothetical protein ANCCAN_09733, partial [Ancylostoma caninum]